MDGQEVYDESKIIASNFIDVSNGMHKTAINLACVHVIKNIFDNHVEKKDKQKFVDATLKAIKEMLVVDDEPRGCEECREPLSSCCGCGTH